MSVLTSLFTRASGGLTRCCRWQGLMALVLLSMTACAQTPPVERMTFEVCDAVDDLPVAGAHATITLSRAPFWFDGQPIQRTTDHHGSANALLAVQQTAYHFLIQAQGYPDTVFDLPVFSNDFPFNQWLTPLPARTPHAQVTSATNQPDQVTPLKSPLEIKITMTNPPE